MDPAASLMDPRSGTSLISDVRDVPLADLARHGSAWHAVAVGVVARVAETAHAPGLPSTTAFNSAI